MDAIKSGENAVLTGIFTDNYSIWFDDVCRRGARQGHILVDQIDSSQTIQARINHGRWIAHCPFCAGAEYVFLEHPVFYCQSCWMEAVGGQGLRVIVPSAKARTGIEGELLKRPLVATRNWSPGETVKSLAAENAERGIK